MPSPLHGSKAGILFNGYDLSPFFNSLGDNATIDAAEETTFGPLGTPVTAKSFIPGLEDAQLDAAGKWAVDHAVGAPNKDQVADVLEAAIASARGGHSLAVFFPFGDGFGNNCSGYQVDTNDYQINSPVNGIVSVTAKFQSSSGVQPLNVLHPLQSEAATGNGGSLDAGALYNSAKWKGLAAQLHVTDMVGTNAACKLQHSADGVTWVDLASFTAVTAKHKSQRIVFTGTVNRYLRAQWTLTGGAATFHIAAGRIPA